MQFEIESLRCWAPAPPPLPLGPSKWHGNYSSQRCIAIWETKKSNSAPRAINQALGRAWPNVFSLNDAGVTTLTANLANWLTVRLCLSGIRRCANMARVKGQLTATAPNVSLMVSRVAWECSKSYNSALDSNEGKISSCWVHLVLNAIERLLWTISVTWKKSHYWLRMIYM